MQISDARSAVRTVSFTVFRRHCEESASVGSEIGPQKLLPNVFDLFMSCHATSCRIGIVY